MYRYVLLYRYTPNKTVDALYGTLVHVVRVQNTEPVAIDMSILVGNCANSLWHGL